MAFAGTELAEVVTVGGDLTVAEVGATKLLTFRAQRGAASQVTLNDRVTGAGALYTDSAAMNSGEVNGIAACWTGTEFLVAASTDYSPQQTRRFRIDETGIIRVAGGARAPQMTVSAIVNVGSAAVIVAGSNMKGPAYMVGAVRVWDLTTDVYAAPPTAASANGIAVHSGTIYVTYTAGGVLTVSTYDPSTGAATPVSTTTGGWAVGRGVYHDGWIWWQTNNTAAPYFGFSPSTGATKFRTLTPATGVPALPGFIHPPAILDGVAYRINGDSTTMFAVDLNSGQWLSDDLVTVRGGRRFGVLVNNGNLWIPTSATPP